MTKIRKYRIGVPVGVIFEWFLKLKEVFAKQRRKERKGRLATERKEWILHILRMKNGL